MRNSDKFGEKREWRPADYGMANAFAKIIRRDFPELGIVDAVAKRFRVEPGKAKGLIYATASRGTLDFVMRDPRNFGLWLECLADVSGTTLEQHLTRQREDAARERAQWEARERNLESLEARLRAGRPPDAGRPR